MADNQKLTFSSLANGDNGHGVSENSAMQTTENKTSTPPSGFTKFKPEEQMPNFENSAFYHARQEQNERNATGSDRKRGRRAMDESSIDDILGQCKRFLYLFVICCDSNFVCVQQ